MLEGHLLNERYKVIKMIGGGGMANVYLGHDIILDRDVAIKVLRLEYANDDEFITRFHREAQSATSLSHPNIVNIYDVGEEDNIYYMVMEYVEGVTLKKYIQLYGPVPVQEAIEIMQQLTSAIEHAHENNIVHRDIKPQNILINDYGQAKITDFGIALALSATSLTQTNSVLGSVHYLSPEQARGGIATRKSDIYSLGIVFFEMLTGRIPFSGQSAVSIALKHLQANTPSVRQWNPNIPQSIENIVLKATTKDPFYRYNTVEALEEDMVSSLDPSRLNEPPYVPPEDEGENTKAVPVISDQTYASHNNDQDTLVHTKSNTIPTNVENNSKNDKPKKKDKKSKKKKLISWLIASFFILIASGLFALFVLPNWLQPDDVTIPDLTGETFDNAEQILSDLGLKVVKKEDFSDDISADHVIRTNPSADTNTKEGKEVLVYVSLGEEKEEFSNYEGRDFNQVERILREKGYKDVEYIEVYSDKPEGHIVTQLTPQANTKVAPSKTIVQFEVSKGKKVIELDDLSGMTESEAKEYLSDHNLAADITEEHSKEVKEGEVISQSPKAGAEIKEDETVHLVVSLGQKEKPPITHNVSFTVPYTGGDDGQGESENNSNSPQFVRIYVEDMNNDLTSLYETESIREDTDFSIRLTIAPDKVGTYKVERDDEVILQKTIAYEEVEGD
ncbi:Serine/threonine-protein kinase PrkC [Paraliobacillus sp. PM-2]|uniref:Stk1 family PASTA domain-containing Ser/Thr kinase n=1 Tax=Paraliobacillus sp. PM-2 TaxID=1462524 RepID=UPI00061C4A44|nr:Stk1 family PASTA domain-containing Ser/Thr kinase [Paraliobacillus sp. PM-2]CQR47743.1 Serine/threonine-protein kinase PrkC [Paraliobacillus sp. PM-2]